MLFRPYSSSRLCNTLRFLFLLLVDNGMSQEIVRDRSIPSISEIGKASGQEMSVIFRYCVVGEMM
jgi:hypothetical protein